MFLKEIWVNICVVKLTLCQAAYSNEDNFFWPFEGILGIQNIEFISRSYYLMKAEWGIVCALWNSSLNRSLAMGENNIMSADITAVVLST
jgi:hypothetical protein